MENIFGISMTTILIVVASIMSIYLVTVGLIAWRNPVIFRMALRNIPRRRAQSILIMLGLMLSTMIIAAALTTGDSLNNSFRSAAFDNLGEVDQIISVTGDRDTEGTISVANPTLDASLATMLETQFQNDPDIAAFMPVLNISAPVVNDGSGLSEPMAIISGVDPTRLDAFGGFTSINGERIDFANLPEGTVVVSRDLASATRTAAGDQLTFYYRNQPVTVTVAAVVEGAILTGMEAQTADAGPAQTTSNRLLGLAIPLETLQSITGLDGQARFIAVSNTGGVRDGLERTDIVIPRLESALDTVENGGQLGVSPIKQSSVESAELLGNTFMSLFVALGMFSISAGILLIFLIFMMLAAERRAEMGMARAVGMKRNHLIQGFIIEGAAYALGAGLIGTLLGIGAAAAMTTLLSTLSGDNITINTYASLRSLAIAYALGVTITFLTVIFASVRSSRLNIVAAIRDLPDETQPASRVERPRWRWWTTPAIARSAMLLPLVAVWNVVFFVPRLLVWMLRTLAHYAGWGPIIAAAGAILIIPGMSMPSMFVFSAGLSTLVLGVALTLTKRLPSRAVYTTASALMLLYWLLPDSVTQRMLPNVGDGGPEMLFVSGIFMVAYATLIVMWNADLIVNLVSVFGRTFSRWLPAVKTAVAYPLASRGRTGMTIAMFSIVIFSLVMVRTISGNFSELLFSDDARAGWDIVMVTNTSNPVEDLQGELAAGNVNLNDVNGFGRLNSLDVENTQVRNAGDVDWKRYSLNGMDDDFVTHAEIPLQARTSGYDSDQAVWDAIFSGEPVAIIDMEAFDNEFAAASAYAVPDGTRITDGSFQPFSIEIHNPQTGTQQTVQVVGVIGARVSTLTGIYLPEDLFEEVSSSPDSTRIFVQMVPSAGIATDDLARDIESALRQRGVQAIPIQEQIDEQQAAGNLFFVMLQGFMGLGILVGIAALGVISFRAVVERRQQIGMLRAIGYRRNMVAASFLIESLVIAGLGVLIGVVLALFLARNLITGGGIGAGFETYVIPWTTISLVVAATLVASALMTWIPARKASSVPIAEALRYE